MGITGCTLPIVEGVAPRAIVHATFRTPVDWDGWDDKWVSSTQESNHSKYCGGEHLKEKERDRQVLKVSQRLPSAHLTNQAVVEHDVFRHGVSSGVKASLHSRWDLWCLLEWILVSFVPFFSPIPLPFFTYLLMTEVLVMVDTFEPWFLTLLRIESLPNLCLSQANMKGCLL